MHSQIVQSLQCHCIESDILLVDNREELFAEFDIKCIALELQTA